MGCPEAQHPWWGLRVRRDPEGGERKDRWEADQSPWRRGSATLTQPERRRSASPRIRGMALERWPFTPYVLRMRILVVEDDPALRASVARGLREASYEVDEAADGTEGLSMASSGGYDAVVLDILLPGMDGIALCAELRSQDEWVPILMLTALDAVEQRIKGLNAGADDYLGKPFDFGELLARLRALTRRRGEGVEVEVRVGDLCLDTRRRLVRRGDRTIELTAKEYDLLLFLARNAGRVVSRNELMATLWDDPEHAYSNVIDVYASRLRKKLDEEGDPTLLSTFRGVGYMIEAPEAGARGGHEPGGPPDTG